MTKPAHHLAGLPGLFVLAFAAATAAAEPVIWNLADIHGPHLYSRPFELRKGARLAVEGVGAGSESEPDLLSYGWILDVQTREPAWRMTRENTRSDRGNGDRVYRGAVELPAGRYIAYFSAFGRHYAKIRQIRIPGLGTLGIIKSEKSAFFTDWDEIGNPERWRFRIEVESDDFDDADLLPYHGDYEPDAFIRLAPLGDNANRDVAFRADRAVSVQVRGCAEYSELTDEYVDRCWIGEAFSRRPVWKISRERTRPAGGDRKNHSFDETVELQAGDYVLVAVTDDSHAYDAWNAAPPFDPQSWGVMLRPVSARDRDALEIISDPQDDLVIARIDRVPDRAYVRKAFSLSKAIPVRIEGIGEFADWNGNCFWDYGWLVTAPSLKTLWSMEDTGKGEYAGGHPKNRMASVELTLSPGKYILNYVTDDSHAYGRWNASPPMNPAAWGIAVYATEPDFDRTAVKTLNVADADPAIISLAPCGDDVDREQTFQLRKATTLRIVALGEVVGRRFYDYGWIDNVDTGKTVWEMEFDNTRHAGGDAKNRMADTNISLPAGRYRVHYVTDSTHSFESWNAVRPDHPELWGITIYRAD